ncbi:MAG: hypothetical protein EOP82_27480 [Variovorax sp.]|nr:MAG: hypothetical protein EOP82_27480 [Variovorax sp.]
MPSDKALEGTRDAEALYAWWLNLIPSLFGVPAPKAPVAADESSPLPFPLGPVSQALTLTQQLLGPLYQGYFQSLLAHPEPGKAFIAFQELMQDQLQKAAEGFAGIGQTLSSAQDGVSAGGWNLMRAPMALYGQAMEPLSLNLERAYGGLADAFGLAPSREFQAAGRELAAAALARQQARAEYMGVIVGALAKGSEGLLARLRVMGENGESVDSLLALVRLWSRAVDEAMHAAMQSPKALETAARLVRATTRSRAQKQRMVAIASEALNVPTRAEVDDAYREIQELKREMRRLRKSIGAMPATPALAEPAPASTSSSPPGRAPAPARSRTSPRAPAAQRKKTSKVIPS